MNINRRDVIGVLVGIIGSLIILLYSVVAAQANEDVTLGWGYDVAEEANITEYLIYYADNSNPAAWTLIQMDTLLPSAREATVVIAGTDDICFILRAANGAIMSANSNVACWTVPPPPPPDPVPVYDLIIK